MSSPIAYHFWSPTCAPCKVIKPIVEDLKEEFSQIQWKSVNIQDDPENITSKLGVSVVPTIAVVHGTSIEKHSGTQAAGYYRILRNALRNSNV